MAAAVESHTLKTPERVLLVYREPFGQAYERAEKIASWFQEQGVKVYTSAEQKLITGTKPVKTPKDFAKISLIIVLGGDGTYLRALRLSLNYQTPIIGINMGSLGFLTKHRIEEIPGILTAIMAEKMLLSPRIMLKAMVLRKKKSRGEFVGLNDVVIERGGYSHLINTSLFCEGRLVSEIKADGIIVCSPTGSTAYNLAAGGPVMHPDCNSIVVTPIAPHSLTSRPVIFPQSNVLLFKIQNKEQKGLLVVDGQRRLELSKEDEVVIERAEQLHWLVHAPDYDYFRLLRDKLKFGDRD